MTSSPTRKPPSRRRGWWFEHQGFDDPSRSVGIQMRRGPATSGKRRRPKGSPKSRFGRVRLTGADVPLRHVAVIAVRNGGQDRTVRRVSRVTKGRAGDRAVWPRLEPMQKPNGGSRPTVPLVAIIVAALTFAACGRDDSTTSAAPTDSPSATPSIEPTAAAAAVTQTETGWGRIWDDVPAGFPRFPTSAVADDISPDPVSGTYAVDSDDTAQIAAWMQNALETASFRTDSLSGPLEDGGFVIESVGQGDCRIQTSVRPMGGLTFVVVRYGAACPMG